MTPMAYFRASPESRHDDGNYLLQRVIQCGGDRLQVAIAERVGADVVTGEPVVGPVRELRGGVVFHQRALSGAAAARDQRVPGLALDGDDLAELVRGVFSNYVVSKLLLVAKEVYIIKSPSLLS
uniref:Uncharacterized protein n=2 Tax=Zea mays TaxID=4577 RepID=A0A804UKF8_MAIZE